MSTSLTRPLLFGLGEGCCSDVSALPAYHVLRLHMSSYIFPFSLLQSNTYLLQYDGFLLSRIFTLFILCLYLAQTLSVYPYIGQPLTAIAVVLVPLTSVVAVNYWLATVCALLLTLHQQSLSLAITVTTSPYRTVPRRPLIVATVTRHRQCGDSANQSLLSCRHHDSATLTSDQSLRSFRSPITGQVATADCAITTDVTLRSGRTHRSRPPQRCAFTFLSIFSCASFDSIFVHIAWLLFAKIILQTANSQLWDFSLSFDFRLSTFSLSFQLSNFYREQNLLDSIFTFFSFPQLQSEITSSSISVLRQPSATLTFTVTSTGFHINVYSYFNRLLP